MIPVLDVGNVNNVVRLGILRWRRTALSITISVNIALRVFIIVLRVRLIVERRRRGERGI